MKLTIVQQARLNVIERLLGHAEPVSNVRGSPSVFVLVDHMFDQPDKYGFNANAIRFSEDLANAITAASRNMDVDSDGHPEDHTHQLIWPLARQAVLDILDSDYGQEAIEEERERLEAEEREYQNDLSVGV